MKYMGSKGRHAKDLLPIILKNRKPEQWYVEPFVGGFNMIDKVDGNRIANDLNYYLIELFKAIQDGWEPPSEVSEELYYDVKEFKEKKYPPFLVGFVGFPCSYAGKWFGGYARGKTERGISRNYALEAKKSLLIQAPKIKEINIFNLNYLILNIPQNSIIYCDPPYKNTTKYRENFNHEEFWDWCREKQKEGHQVFVSEYDAPKDFKCIWEKKVYNTLVKNTGSKIGTEKLFVLN